MNTASWGTRAGAYLIDSIPSAVLYGIAVILASTSTTLTLIVELAAIAVWGYNRWFQQGSTGQSWGKKVLNIRLVSEETGAPLGTLMAFVRDLAHFIDIVICGIGFLFPLWDAKKQTIADKLIKTAVVSA